MEWTRHKLFYWLDPPRQNRFNVEKRLNNLGDPHLAALADYGEELQTVSEQIVSTGQSFSGGYLGQGHLQEWTEDWSSKIWNIFLTPFEHLQKLYRFLN